jgi:hypothetical protein
MRSPLSQQIKAAAFGLFATAAFLSSGTTAMAGGAEVKALQAALQGTSLSTATEEQLFEAFKIVIADPKFAAKKGIVAGEALKAAGPNAESAGAFFAQGLIAEPNLVPAAEINAFIAAAGKAAGSGKGLDVSQIPDLANPFLDDDTEATTVALAAKNKPAAGAILGGRAQDLTDAGKIALANAAIGNKALASAVQDIARYIGAEADDSADFAVAVAVANPTNTKNAIKIATGVIAGDPTNAGAITSELFLNTTLRPVLDKGAATYAKAVGTVADIEELVKVANVLGTRVQGGAIKLAKAAALVKTLATAIALKPTVDKSGAPILVNRLENKVDEIVEVAAGLLAGVIGSAEFNSAKKPAAAVLAILKSAVGAAKTAIAKTLLSKADKAALLTRVSADVAGSLVVTLQDESSTLSDPLKQAIRTALLDPKATKSLGGTTTLNAITAAYANNDDPRFENGYAFGDATDPETDVHAFL